MEIDEKEIKDQLEKRARESQKDYSNLLQSKSSTQTSQSAYEKPEEKPETQTQPESTEEKKRVMFADVSEYDPSQEEEKKVPKKRPNLTKQQSKVKYI